MNDDRYNKILLRINDLYKKRPYETMRKLDQVVSEIESNDSGNGNMFSDIDKGVLARCIFGIAIIILGFVNPSNIALYMGGCIFFIAGLMIGLGVPGFGLIFLFSHGMTGLGLLCAVSLGLTNTNNEISLSNFLTNPIMSDNPKNIIMYLIVIGILIVAATISSILYNLSENFRKKEYSIYIPLVLYFVAVLMIVILPKIIGYLY